MSCPEEITEKSAPTEASIDSTQTSSSYGQIFKSTAFTGGAALTNVIFGIVRTKFMAVLLGASGIGLMGLYGCITGLAGTLAGMGIGSSGVRQIAEAVGTGDEVRVSKMVIALRRTALVLGTVGGLFLACLSVPLSLLTFGNRDHAVAIALLGVTILIGAVTSAQGALIQGLRRIGDLARLNVLGSLASTCIGIPIIWLLGMRGIVPMMIILPAVSLVCSWWFARKVAVVPVDISWKESLVEARALVGLGMAFMTSSLLGGGVAFVTNLLIVRDLGLAAAGQYAAAYSLAGTYAGFILSAMGADFYPRITAVAGDNRAVIRLVNEQAEFALLLAIPGILGTLVAAPWVIHAFYARGFDAAVPVLQWQVLGILGRVVSWPVAFIQLAKGDGRTFILTEAVGYAFQILLIVVLIPRFGVSGAGMAFAGLYVIYTIVILALMRKIVGFSYGQKARRLLSWSIPLVIGVFILEYGQAQGLRVMVGVVISCVASWFCVRGLLIRIPRDQLRHVDLIARYLRRVTILPHE